MLICKWCQRTLLSLWLILALASLTCRAAETIPLAGQWRFKLDPTGTGTNDHWFSQKLPDRIPIPGVLEAQGYGDEISTRTPWVLSLYDKLWYLREDYQKYTNDGSVKVPFLCQPPRHYIGAAWYQRDLDIPADWKDRRVSLFLERPHWKSTVWLDDHLIASEISLCTPHEFDFGVIPPGHHQLTLCVDNRMILPYRPDAHSVSDSLDDAWNGIAGRIELRATPTVWIGDVQVFPDLAGKRIRLRNRLENSSGLPVTVQYQAALTVRGGANHLPPFPTTADSIEVKPGGTVFEFNISLTNSTGDYCLPWDEFHPALYNLAFHIQEQKDATLVDAKDVTFGMRDFHAEGNQFILNGRPVNFRGTHFGGDFPLTGYPPTDAESWKKIFRKCQDYGLNHMRFHSWCPPEAAFEAADELGFYLQIECGMWNNFTPNSIQKMLYDETERILRDFGNHPSLMLISASNEAGGLWNLANPIWVKHFRELDQRHLYTPDTGWSLINRPDDPVDGRADYLAVGRIGQARVRGEPGWYANDYRDAVAGMSVPVIAHEVGQWCAYPDFGVISKFTGFMRPGNYEIFRDSLAANGLSDRDRDFTVASGRFQVACYKEEIEANLRTPGMSGFQLLDLHDYVGQGTALVGVLDPFWQEKGYITAAEWRRFCGPTVPLARLGKPAYTSEDEFDADVEVAHFGPEPLTNAVPSWRIEDGHGKTVASGQWPAQTIPLGKNIPLGKVAFKLDSLPAPQACKLVVSLQPSGGAPIENDWNFWVYPPAAAPSSTGDVLVTSSWDEAETNLAAGRKVLYVPRNTDLDWSCPPLAPVPIFWNRLMNPGWARMLGFWCDTKHPALAGFPTEINCDWQWAELMRGTRAVNLEGMPAGLQPIVQAIDDWNRNWKLGLIFECRMGAGRLMVCAINIADVSRNPTAAQLRRSLLDYMNSPRFQPKTEVSSAAFGGIVFDNRLMRKLGATAEANGTNAGALVDGDVNTLWTANTVRDAVRSPQTVTITFPSAIAMRGLIIMPRQNDRDHLGDVRGYVVETSDDGQNWKETARGELVSAWRPQKIKFGGVVNASKLRFTALSGFGADASVAVAELAVDYAGPALSDAATGGNMQFQRARSTSTDVDEGGPAGTNRVR